MAQMAAQVQVCTSKSGTQMVEQVLGASLLVAGFEAT
jgi:hypothetical protein